MRNLDCGKAQDWIVSNLDNRLDCDDRRTLERHLATCRACRDAEIAYQNLWASLKGAMPEDPGEAFWNDYRVSLNKKLDEASSRRPVAWSLRAFPWKATAVVVPAMVALFLVVFLGLGGEATRQPFVDHAGCQKLFQELSEIYGPTSEEIIPGAYFDFVTTTVAYSRRATATRLLPRWFEVEDEPNQPYL